MNGRTPAEAIAAVTQALPQFLCDDRHTEHLSVTISTFAQIAELNGRTMTTDGPATLFTSADRRCVLVHRPDAEARRRVRHSVLDDTVTDGSTAFTRAAPTRPVAHLFAHLASTAPVERTCADLPFIVHNNSQAPNHPHP